MCLDAAVMQGVECQTEHHFLCIRVRAVGNGFHHKTPARIKQFDVAKLLHPHQHSLREAFQEDTVKRIQTEWCQDGSVEDKWSVIRSTLTKAAESVIGTESRHQLE